jgi:glycosyltransferase involved in cell wall biosynthesis
VPKRYGIFNRLIYALWVRRKFLALARTYKIQIVEAAEYDAESVFIELFGCPVPVVVRLQAGTYIVQKMAGKAIRHPVAILSIMMEWLAIHMADALTAPTYSMASYCQRLLKLSERAIQVLPNTVSVPEDPCNKRQRDTSKRRILYVGRLEKRKSPDFLARVIPEILGVFPNILFTFIGLDDLQGPGKTSMQVYCESLIGVGFMERVEFLGKRSHAEVEEYLSASDIFVLPSRFESFGVVYAEAMLHGLPVIACLGAGVEEVVPQNVAGFLINHGDVEALRDAILLLLSDECMRREMGEAGREFALSHFSAPVVAEAHEVFYQSLISGEVR